MPLQAVRLRGGDGMLTDYRYPLRRSDGKIVRECCCLPPGGYIYSSMYAPAVADRCHDETREWELGSLELETFTVTVGTDFNCASAESQHTISAHAGLIFYLPEGWAEYDIGALGTVFTAELFIRQIKPLYGSCQTCGGKFDYGSDPCGNSGLGDYVFSEGIDEGDQYYIQLDSDGYLFSAECDVDTGHPHCFDERIEVRLL